MLWLMDPQSEISKYLEAQKARGLSDDQIRSNLTQNGWSAQQIDHILPKQPVSPLPQTNPVVVSSEPQTTENSTQHSNIIHQQPQKYKVFQALKDSLTAIRQNAKAFFAVLIISASVCLLGYVAIMLPIGFLASSDPALGFALLPALLIVTLLAYLWMALSGSYVVANTAVALNDGFNGRRSKIRDLLKQSLRNFLRIAIANALGLLVTFLPSTISGVIILFSVWGSGEPNVELMMGAVVVFIIGLAWALIASLRLALVQQVATFEPNLNARQALKRSSFLLRKGGQWFLIKGFLLVAVIYVALSFVTSTPVDELDRSMNPATMLPILLVYFGTLTSLTMLYINRAAIRGDQAINASPAQSTAVEQ